MNTGITRPWAVEVLSVGAASAGAVAWRLSGRLHVSAIVKATFAFAPNAAMTPALPIPMRAAEVRHPDHPEGSIRYPLDTAPPLGCLDVMFVGHAYAPGLVPAPRVAVRLAVRSRTGAMLLDKSLMVLGDRVFFPGKPPPEPAPFTSIPMIYERAYGGPDHAANPVGVGQFAELAGRRRLPNIVHPDNPPRSAVEPAGFAPISIRWPQRRRLLGAIPRDLLERPIAEIPGELDRSYFQAAPVDQRARTLDGDEWIVLEGLHPDGAIETRLPSARGVARVYLPDGSSRFIALVADTLFVDGDAQQCSITWRGSFPIPSVADLPATAIVAGVELPGQPVLLPDRFPAGDLAPHASGPKSTVQLAPPPDSFPSGGFSPGSSRPKVIVQPAPPLAPGPPPLPRAPPPLPRPPPLPLRPAPPQQQVPAPPQQQVPAPPQRRGLGETIAIDPGFDAEPPSKKS